MSKKRIFVSYAREDASSAQRLAAALRAAGHEVWLDSDSLLPGQDWKLEIERAVRRTDIFVALLSRWSGKRGYVQKELRLALEVLDEMPPGQVFIIPARLTFYGESFHPRLNALNWVDLFPSFDDGVAKILSAVGQTSTDGQAPERAPVPVRVFGARWFGGDAYAEIPTFELPDDLTREQEGEAVWRACEEGRVRVSRMAEIIDRNPKSITEFWGRACAYQFDLEASPRIPWIIIDSVFVRVSAYAPLPPFRATYPQPFYEAHVYYVEVDDPTRADRSEFQARAFVMGGSERPFGQLRLSPNAPERLVLRINALTPGIYDYSVGIRYSYGEMEGECWVIEDEQCLFAP